MRKLFITMCILALAGAIAALVWLQQQPAPQELLMAAPVSLANRVTSRVDFVVQEEQRAFIKIALLERFDYGEMKRILGHAVDDQPGDLKLGWRLLDRDGAQIDSGTSRQYGYAPFISEQRRWGITIGKVKLLPGVSYRLELVVLYGEFEWDEADPQLELMATSLSIKEFERNQQRRYMLLLAIAGASMMLLLMCWSSRRETVS